MVARELVPLTPPEVLTLLCTACSSSLVGCPPTSLAPTQVLYSGIMILSLCLVGYPPMPFTSAKVLCPSVKVPIADGPRKAYNSAS